MSNIERPPNNIEAEQSIISAILLDENSIKECLKAGLKHTDFFEKAYNLIYRASVKLYKEKKNIDITTISEVLTKNKRLSDIGGIDTLYDLSTFILSVSGLKDWIDIVIEKSRLRDIKELAKSLNIKSNDGNIKDIIKYTLDKINELKTEVSDTDDFKHITYQDKISRAYMELNETDHKDIMKRGYPIRDNMLGGIYGGKLYVIGADTGVGKTTFVDTICNNVSSQGFRVVKYSLEDRMEDKGKEEIFYIANRLRRLDDKKPFGWVEFVNNELKEKDKQYYIDKASEQLLESKVVELDKNKQISIDELIGLMEQECKKGTKLFSIDHLHYFEMDKSDRHDLQIQNTMHKLNELARKENVAILMVAHYKKNKAFGQMDIPSYDDFKDGASIKQVANVIIQITRDMDDYNGESSFYITKLRGPIKPKIIKAVFDIGTFEYKFKDEVTEKKDISF